MGRFVFAMNLSLDGFVDHQEFAPDPVLLRHWIQVVTNTAVSLYGRRTYEIMRYWEVDDPGWGNDEHAFAASWRAQHKWVVSGTLTEVGPNATLVRQDIDATLRRLKADADGDIEVAGTVLARSLADLSLIDEYRLYYHPVVLGQGTPMFRGALPRLRLLASDRIGTDVIRLTYAPV